MSPRVTPAAIVFGALLFAYLGACVGGEREGERLSLEDLGRNAAITTLNGLKVQSLIRDGKTDEAVEFIDSTYLQQLMLLREFDERLSADEQHVRLRNRIVVTLQREWLQHPPRYLDELSAEYLERTCSRIPNCPRGRIKGREEIPR
jgi:hypothetical protein